LEVSDNRERLVQRDKLVRLALLELSGMLANKDLRVKMVNQELTAPLEPQVQVAKQATLGSVVLKVTGALQEAVANPGIRDLRE